jgi:hypothetical protein
MSQTQEQLERKSWLNARSADHSITAAEQVELAALYGPVAQTPPLPSPVIIRTVEISPKNVEVAPVGNPNFPADRVIQSGRLTTIETERVVELQTKVNANHATRDERTELEALKAKI